MADAGARAGETLRGALERTLCDAIRCGALRDGVRLPSSRALAQALGVSRGVVSDAYGSSRRRASSSRAPRARRSSRRSLGRRPPPRA
jgi:GntR family transcriptional regulator/MocR family aminotransferase